MSLLTDPGFHDAPGITIRQKLCFWSGFLYYIGTAVNALVAPLPGLVMLWFLPDLVFPENSVPLLGSVVLWLLVLPSVFRCRWSVTVLRVQLIYSFAHAVAIVHLLTGRTQEWVATGAANRSATPIAVAVTRTMRLYLATVTALLWGGLAHHVAVYGWGRCWAMVALAVFAGWVAVPVMLTETPFMLAVARAGRLFRLRRLTVETT